MRVFIVHAHPEPMSFSGAMTRTATAALADAGHEVVVSDLYAIGFNPVSGRHNFTTVSDPDYYRQQPKRPTPRRMTDLRQSFNARWITCSGATRWLCNFRYGGSACRPSSRAGWTEFSPPQQGLIGIDRSKPAAGKSIERKRGNAHRIEL